MFIIHNYNMKHRYYQGSCGETWYVHDSVWQLVRRGVQKENNTHIVLSGKSAFFQFYVKISHKSSNVLLLYTLTLRGGGQSNKCWNIAALLGTKYLGVKIQTTTT